MKQRSTVLWVLFLTISLGGVRLEAQETVNVGWPSREVKQEASHSVPGDIAAKGRGPEKLSPPRMLDQETANENKADSRPPFPVTTPMKIDYPRKAVRKGWEGQTVVAVEVLPDGSVGRTALAKTSGHEVLDQAAREAIKTWKFGTESEKDDTVPQYVDIPVTFKLEDR